MMMTRRIVNSSLDAQSGIIPLDNNWFTAIVWPFWITVSLVVWDCEQLHIGVSYKLFSIVYNTFTQRSYTHTGTHRHTFLGILHLYDISSQSGICLLRATMVSLPSSFFNNVLCKYQHTETHTHTYTHKSTSLHVFPFI